jgi:hypothetical protein
VRIERVFKAIQACGLWHELRNPLRPRTADQIRIEPALLPDQAREEIDWQIISRGSGSQCLAKACRRWWRSLRFGLTNFVVVS